MGVSFYGLDDWAEQWAKEDERWERDQWVTMTVTGTSVNAAHKPSPTPTTGAVSRSWGVLAGHFTLPADLGERIVAAFVSLTMLAFGALVASMVIRTW